MTLQKLALKSEYCLFISLHSISSQQLICLIVYVHRQTVELRLAPLALWAKEKEATNTKNKWLFKKKRVQHWRESKITNIWLTVCKQNWVQLSFDILARYWGRVSQNLSSYTANGGQWKHYGLQSSGEINYLNSLMRKSLEGSNSHLNVSS